jgi:hypothetical protein
MGEKPTAAAVLTIVGGGFILLFGIAVLALASILGALLGGLGGAPVDPTAILVAYALPSIILGIVVLALGALMLMKPGSARILGVVVLVLSIVSFFFGGGFFIGAILGLIGGILGIVFKPTPAMAPMMQPPMAPPSMPPP